MESLSLPAVPLQPSPGSIAARIRKIRRERGWSRADIERLSHGTLKAAVLASYERGDRALSVKRAIEIANLLAVPLHHLLDTPEQFLPSSSPSRMLVDLRRVRHLMDDPIESTDPFLRAFSAFVAWIASRRGDWNGEVMSLRQGDQTTLAIMAMTSEKDLSQWLDQKKILVTEKDRP